MKRIITAATFILALNFRTGFADDETGFEPIFDGKSLAGWLGQDVSFWSVEDEAITGTITSEHSPPMNQYLVWRGGLVEDFELKLDFRLTGSTTPNTNGGFQFRSRRLPNGDVAGYQVDNNFGQPWKVRLYDEFGRHDLALEGEYGRFDPAGRRHVEQLALLPGARDFRLDAWHEYHLAAVGRRLTLAINGKLVAECDDDDSEQFEPAGVLAMQLHTGPPMKAQFRNLRIKRLSRASTLSAREQLLTTAALAWELGERVASHQPPLKTAGKLELDPAAGPTTNTAERAPADGRVPKRVRVDRGYFDAGPDWNTPGDAITVYLRASADRGDWNRALFAKRGGQDRVHFNLFGADLPTSPGVDIGFELRTDKGFYRASFPVSEIDAAGWHDLVGRYDGKAIEILCDGRSMARQPAGGDLIANREPMLIGAESDDGQIVRRFSGALQEAALWTRALSDGELRLLTHRPTRSE